MPHVNTSGGEDLASTDEIKVYKDEGEQEEQRTSEDISEVKLGLLNESERESEQVYFFIKSTIDSLFASENFVLILYLLRAKLSVPKSSVTRKAKTVALVYSVTV